MTAETLISRLCEVRKFNPDMAWMKKASKLGGTYVGKSLNWIYYEFPDERSAQKAANYASDLGLHHNWNDLEVGIRFV